MGVSVASASSQYVQASTVSFTTLPLVVGAWVRLTAVANATRRPWAMTNAAATDTRSLYMSSAELLGIQVVGTGTGTLTTSTAISAAVWHFVVGRFIANNNRRVSVLHGSGLVEHGVNTTNSSQSGLDTEIIGARMVSGAAASDFWNGEIGELFICNADIYDAAADLPDSLVRQLAYGGPFSVPNVAASLFEYRSLRNNIGSGGGGQDNYCQNGAKFWTPVASPLLSYHPPLPYWYERPRAIVRPRIF
jgi:hypothetical protein